MILIDTQKEEFSKLKEIRIFGKIDNEERFNGDLLVIGLGGIGGNIVCNLKGMLREHINPENNINFLLIDSDIPAMEQTIKDSMDGVGLNALEVISIYRPNLESVLANGITENPIHPNLAKWMNPDFPGLSIGTDGAGGNRQIGRLMFSNAYEDLRILLFEKVEEVYYKSSGKLDVIIVSGVAGGTGSGILADVTFNIKALAKARKWNNFRIGGCLLMPDVLFGNKSIADDEDKKALLNANGCATLKEIDYLMKLKKKDEPFTFESTTHRLSMKDNIFDSCILVSGKKDDQGYIPENIICSDTAYFLFKLACNKFIGDEKSEDRKLLRDVFFEDNGKGLFKVINQSDYKVPIKEIENMSEHAIFVEAYKKLHTMPDIKSQVDIDMEDVFGELRKFLTDKPGEEINLNINGLIRIAQFERPVYKLIKKGQDNLRTSMARQLTDMKQDMPILIKSVKNKLYGAIDSQIQKYMSKYGPFVTLELIGAGGIGESEYDRGMIVEIQKLEELQRSYQPTGEYSRIIDSIKDMVSKRFFTFPSAKRETENGYYDACVKETLATERNLIVDGLHSQDVFGDAIRLLREKAERIYDIYSQFDEDLKNAVEDLANIGKNVTGYLLRGANQKEFLPSDFVTESRINEFRDGLIQLMVNNEANIDNGRVVAVKTEMEKIYKNALISIGVYAPEKMISVAFSDKKPTLQESNVMFVSPTNDRREEIMERAAKSFVEGVNEKKDKKKLCIMKDGFENIVSNKKYISLPEGMPYFSKAVKNVLINEPYNEKEDTITLNAGELEISIDDVYTDVPLSMLECVDDMQKAYDAVNTDVYFGLHTDEVEKDMRAYPNLI